MIKDQLFKRLLIPLAGLCFPLLTGLYPAFHLPVSYWGLMFLFFMAASFFFWTGVVRLTSNLRGLSLLRKNIFLKLVVLTLTAAVYGALLGFVSSAAWQQMDLYAMHNASLLKATLLAAVGATLLALLYEVTFLSVEKEQDSRVLQQIDRERQEAEVSILRNELDPHFFFNSLNTLAALVSEDRDKAHHFVHTLASIYKYFLRHKEANAVHLDDELVFLENYCNLLRIRFDDSIRIENFISSAKNGAHILPCTLQVVVENAIKHNFFSPQAPLVISLSLNGNFIIVSNPLRPKQVTTDSTKIGLRNLKARYRLFTNQSVLVQKNATRFVVKLPILKKASYADKNGDH